MWTESVVLVAGKPDALGNVWPADALAEIADRHQYSAATRFENGRLVWRAHVRTSFDVPKVDVTPATTAGVDVEDTLTSLMRTIEDHAGDTRMLRDEVVGPLLAERDEAREALEAERVELREAYKRIDELLAVVKKARVTCQHGATIGCTFGCHESLQHDRESLGRLVRETWVKWAREQKQPKGSWLTPWERLTEPEREVDRRIGEAVARRVAAADGEPTMVWRCTRCGALRPRDPMYVTPDASRWRWDSERFHHKCDHPLPQAGHFPAHLVEHECGGPQEACGMPGCSECDAAERCQDCGGKIKGPFAMWCDDCQYTRMKNMEAMRAIVEEIVAKPQPGDLIAKTSCPCCGAELTVEHGPDQGDVAVVVETTAVRGEMIGGVAEAEELLKQLHRKNVIIRQLVDWSAIQNSGCAPPELLRQIADALEGS